MSQFGTLTSPNKNHRPFVNIEGQSIEKGNGEENMTSLPFANAPNGPRSLPNQTYTGNPDLVLANLQNPPRTSFGEPSPLHYSLKTALWVQNEIEMGKATLRPERSLESLYNEYPEKKLQEGIEPSTMNLAANIVLQLVNEAGYRWLDKWCPHLDLHEVFEGICVEDKETKLASKKFNVLPEAVDISTMKTTLAELYQQCQNVHSKDSGDVEFAKLMNLIDHGVVFLGALRDCKAKALLQETRSTFQWIPLSLDAKKDPILRQANAELKELNQKYKTSTPNGRDHSEALAQKRRIEELSILDTASEDFKLCRRTFENEMLERLCVLLASTNSSPP
ncbi:hypothetical protein E0Z10_g6958 [Xylaria hypoxylon]|uniref:Uncharacterized protein n=1 Tax=Xylaria hypoxylon TaxID=37992 RepID=A0A4Z0YCS4_9PEZI|nr:hypothetical protein E0Z10_g6958 [Xylaria hypoxylon]